MRWQPLVGIHVPGRWAPAWSSLPVGHGDLQQLRLYGCSLSSQRPRSSCCFQVVIRESIGSWVPAGLVPGGRGWEDSEPGAADPNGAGRREGGAHQGVGPCSQSDLQHVLILLVVGMPGVDVRDALNRSFTYGGLDGFQDFLGAALAHVGDVPPAVKAELGITQRDERRTSMILAFYGES